jgi:hypothetical protein
MVTVMTTASPTWYMRLSNVALPEMSARAAGGGAVVPECASVCACATPAPELTKRKPIIAATSAPAHRLIFDDNKIRSSS